MECGLIKPNFTVFYNIVSPESDKWIGTGWEFFDSIKDAENCRLRHEKLGNCAMLRAYFDKVDYLHLGAAHRINNGGL